MRNPGSQRRTKGSGAVKEEIQVWNSQGGRKDKHFFPLHSLGLDNNNVPFLRTVSGKNLLANSVILKCLIMGIGLGRSLQPPDILLIHCNNKLKSI